MDGAAAKYVGAWELCPEVTELRYWAGFGLIQRGEEERGAALLRETSPPTKAGRSCSRS